MTTTPDLGIPELSQSQANPDVTHNEALQLMQALLKGAISLGDNAPPGSPTNGDVYVLGAAPSGAWSGRANSVAVRVGGAWRFIPGNDSDGNAIAIGARHEGLRIWVQDVSTFYVWTGSPLAWTELLPPDASQVTNTPAGNIAATNVQAALNELDTEKVAKAGDTMTGVLIVNRNASASPVLPTFGLGPALQMYGADGVSGSPEVNFVSFAVSGSFNAWRANTTGAAPSALGAANNIFAINAGGRAATQYLNNKAQIIVRTKNAWTDTDSSTAIGFGTTPNGSTTRAERMTLGDGLTLGSPTGGDQGAGTINATALYDDGVLVFTLAGGNLTGSLGLNLTGTAFIVGNTVANAETLATAVPKVQVHGVTSDSPSYAAIRWDNATAANAPSIICARSRGATVNSRGVVQNGDRIGQILFCADDGTLLSSSSAIRAEIDNTPGAGDLPGRLLFMTSPDGSITLAERMRLDSAGNVQMGGTNTVIDSDRVFRLRQYTVATLPANAAGKHASVTDSNAALTAGIGAVVAGGGANNVPVYNDGANWRIG